jgi:hypothetical protein
VATSKPPASNGRAEGPPEFIATAVVEIVSVELAPEPLTATGEAEKAHAAPAGKPEHAKVTF